MSVDPALLEILRCPDEHHAVLDHDPEAQTLTCTECGRIFEIRDGIPVLLLEEVRQPAEHPGGGERGGEGAGPGEGGAA